MTFKDDHPEMQHLVRQLLKISATNDHIVTKLGKPDEAYQFAEAALALITLERFLRIVLPAAEIASKDTLPNLLEKATSDRLKLLTLPGPRSRTDVIEDVRRVRNALLHGAFEQAATLRNVPDLATYFKVQFQKDVSELVAITNHVVEQIDPETGKPHAK